MESYPRPTSHALSDERLEAWDKGAGKKRLFPLHAVFSTVRPQSLPNGLAIVPSIRLPRRRPISNDSGGAFQPIRRTGRVNGGDGRRGKGKRSPTATPSWSCLRPSLTHRPVPSPWLPLRFGCSGESQWFSRSSGASHRNEREGAGM